MYAQLGSTIFQGLFSYESFKKETQTHYAEVPLIGGKPDLQRTGLALDVISFSIKLHNSFCDPGIRYSELETYRINGEILPFLDGYGNLIGNFVIEKITQTVNQTDAKGSLIWCNCDVELKEYVDPDRLSARKSAAQRNAFALNAKSALIDPSGLRPAPKADIFNSLNTINTSNTYAVNNINAAIITPQSQSVLLKNALRATMIVNQSIIEAQQKMSQYVSIVTSPVGFAESLISAGHAAQVLITDIRSGDISNLSANSGVLTQAISGMNITALPMEELIILRK